MNAAELVPILVPVSFFGTVIALVAMALYFRHRRDASRLEAVKALVEQGKELPLGLLDPPAPVRAGSDLKRGLLLIAAGLGVSACAHLAELKQAVGMGLIPGFIGVAYVIVWWVERRGAGRDVEA